MNNKYVVLACDGGGIRGLASAVILTRLEKKLESKRRERNLVPEKQDFHDYFDLFAGTSTGSIIACGLAHDIPAHEIQKEYLDQGINIFPEAIDAVSRFIFSIRPGGYSQPIYKADYDEEKNVLKKFFKKDKGIKGINNVLNNFFQKKTFGQLKKTTLVTSFDTLNQDLIVFDNTIVEHQGINAWEVVRASSAAPVAFPAHLLSEKKFIDFWKTKGDKERKTINDNGNECIPLVDGGLAANNPAMCAVAKALDLGKKLDELIVVSVGTGLNPPPKENDKLTAMQNSRKDANGWGALEWISPWREIPIIKALFEGSADTADYQVKQLLNPGSSYFRFQPSFFSTFQSFNADAKKLDQMVEHTERYLDKPSTQELMDKLVDILLGLD